MVKRPAPTFLPGEDGKFHCDLPLDGGGTCTKVYNLPQHLGLHRFHHHGIKGESRSTRYSQKHPRAPKGRPGMLSAEDICTTALETLSSSGTIPVHAIPSFNEWVRQTETFLSKLLG